MTKNYWVTPGLKCNALIVRDLYTLTPNDVVMNISKIYDITPQQIKGKVKTRKFSRPRQISIWIIKNLFPKMSLQDIGSIFMRDHATVLHAIKVVENEIETLRPFRKDVINVLESLKINHQYSKGKINILI